MRVVDCDGPKKLKKQRAHRRIADGERAGNKKKRSCIHGRHHHASDFFETWMKQDGHRLKIGSFHTTTSSPKKHGNE